MDDKLQNNRLLSLGQVAFYLYSPSSTPSTDLTPAASRRSGLVVASFWWLIKEPAVTGSQDAITPSLCLMASMFPIRPDKLNDRRQRAARTRDSVSNPGKHQL